MSVFSDLKALMNGKWKLVGLNFLDDPNHLLLHFSLFQV